MKIEATSRLSVEASPAGDQKALEKAIKEHQAQIEPKLLKQGVTKEWLDGIFQKALTDAGYNLREYGNVQKAINFAKSNLKPADLLPWFKRVDEHSKIQDVKREGFQKSFNPENKIAILQKLGLTGAEFVTFCAMIKEQIR